LVSPEKINKMRFQPSKVISCVTLLSLVLPTFARAQAQAFVCPDSSEKRACDSYSELVQARDKGVTDSDVKYVCFRDYSDEFFVMQLSEPFLSPWQWYEWNKTVARYTLKTYPQLPKLQTYSLIQTYSGGVGDDSKMPSLFVLGTLTYVGPEDNGVFVFRAQPTRLDARTKQQVSDPDTVFVINTDRAEFSQKYVSVAKKKVQYSLLVQLSTKRFRESFNFPDDPKSSLEGSGRCIQVNELPKLPSPPPLTEDQQAAKDKLDYCADPPEADEWSAGERKAYCSSPFTYKDDYLAAKSRTPTGRRTPTK
jgi:hypothetical protein